MKTRGDLTLPSKPGTQVSEAELLHVVLTVAAALLNPGQLWLVALTLRSDEFTFR